MNPWHYFFVFLWGYGCGAVGAWLVGGHDAVAVIGGGLMAVAASAAIIDDVRSNWSVRR